MVSRTTYSITSGWVSILSWVVVYTPQIYENYRLKSGEGLSLFFTLFWLLGDLTNLIGGIMINLLPTMLILALYYISCDLILLYQMYIYNKPQHLRWESSPLLPNNNNSKLKSQEDIDNENKHKKLVNLACTGFVFIGGLVAFLLNSNKPYNGHHDLHSDFKAQVIGWISAISYIASRLPQIVKNKHTKCEGLSLPLFMFALLGNTTYVLQVLFESMDKKYLLINLSWLTGTIGTILLDLVVLGQFIYYQHYINNNDNNDQ